jgi:hypothetical protein
MATGLKDRAEALIGRDKEAKPTKPPEDVQQKIKRASERLDQLTPARKECIEFANGNHYAYLNAEGKLQQQQTSTSVRGEGKPSHRVRRSHDLIGPALKAKISAATQRIPSYECNPTTPDAEDFSAAKLAERIADGGYDLWRIKRAFKKLIWNALVTEEGFIRPFWDTSVGPFIEVGEGPKTENVGMGEVGIEVYSGLEVSWEPGVEFEDSRYWITKRARPVEDIEDEPDFIGGKLKPDADTGKTKGTKLAIETEFLERPCPKYATGRRLRVVGERLVFPEEGYPLQDAKGNVVDEPCLHRLSYDVDPSSDRDKGMVRPMIDPMRQFDHASNKVMEWVQLMLTPQFTAPEGSQLTPSTDEPGAVKEWAALPGVEGPKPVQPPNIPPELFTIMDRAQGLLQGIAHESEVPSGVRSGEAVQRILETQQLAWGDFITDVADVHARLMRDCLTLVQMHYTEDRLIKFRGRTGWENIEDFKGADLRGQTDVTVSPGSLEPKTRVQIEQRIMNIAQMFPGHFPPEVLIAAMEGGSAEKLIEGYEDDVARANRIVTLIRTGQFWNEPPRPVFPGEEAPEIDPETGEPMMRATGQMEPIMAPSGAPNPETGEEEQIVTGERPQMEPVMATQLPGWMPRPFDNIAVHKSVVTNWMKTDDWNSLEPAAQEATMAYYSALLDMESKQAQRDAQLQNQQAEELGLSNAAKSPAKPMPSQPALNGAGGETP